MPAMPVISRGSFFTKIIKPLSRGAWTCVRGQLCLYATHLFGGDPTVSSDSKSTTMGVKGGGGISVYYYVNINICMKLAKM